MLSCAVIITVSQDITEVMLFTGSGKDRFSSESSKNSTNGNVKIYSAMASSFEWSWSLSWRQLYKEQYTWRYLSELFLIYLILGGILYLLQSTFPRKVEIRVFLPLLLCIGMSVGECLYFWVVEALTRLSAGHLPGIWNNPFLLSQGSGIVAELAITKLCCIPPILFLIL